jgi:hypothetical protein
LKAIGRDDAGTLMNIAAAEGDLYEQALAAGNEDEAAKHRAAAIDALQRAIRVDPAWRQRAIQLRETGENFTAFKDDEFQQAIGK